MVDVIFPSITAIVETFSIYPFTFAKHDRLTTAGRLMQKSGAVAIISGATNLADKTVSTISYDEIFSLGRVARNTFIRFLHLYIKTDGWITAALGAAITAHLDSIRVRINKFDGTTRILLKEVTITIGESQTTGNTAFGTATFAARTYALDVDLGEVYTIPKGEWLEVQIQIAGRSSVSVTGTWVFRLHVDGSSYGVMLSA